MKMAEWPIELNPFTDIDMAPGKMQIHFSRFGLNKEDVDKFVEVISILMPGKKFAGSVAFKRDDEEMADILDTCILAKI